MSEIEMSAGAAMQAKPVLVLGATGKTGRRVAERLAAAGWLVRSGSRRAAVPFDWDDRATWGPALTDVGAVYISYQPDLAVPGALDTVTAFAQQAADNGVSRLVLLSGRGEDEAQQAEQAVCEVAQAGGVAAAVLRASWFMQNFSESFLLPSVQAGEIVLPAGDVGEPFIDVDDIAEAAVAALTQSGHADRIYELTGPRLLSFAEAVDELAAACGRPLRYRQVPAEDFAGMLTQVGVPAEEAALIVYLFTTVLDGRNAHTTDGVAQALGRPARDFADYARRTAASGIWSAAA